MSIATQHDYAAVGLPRDEEGPVFDKPWQAKAFSLIVHLHRAGLFRGQNGYGRSAKRSRQLRRNPAKV